MKPFARNAKFIFALGCFLFTRTFTHAQALPPTSPFPPTLDTWSFDDTNWLSDLGYAPISYSNLSNVLYRGENNVMLLDSTNAAWLAYNITESSGTNNLILTNGSVAFWFAPSWASTNEGGSGPGDIGELINVGEWTMDASYGVWNIYLDANGANLYFGAQGDDGSETNYLSAPIDWTSNYWHFIVITYTATNTALYLDGGFVTNGVGISIVPGSDVLANGFFVGSDMNGVQQAHGMFDNLATYDQPLNCTNVLRLFNSSMLNFWGNPYNALFSERISPAPSAPTNVPTFRAFTGLLTPLSNAVTCLTDSNLWMTNLTASLTGSGTNQTANFVFSIEGGYENVAYDIFGTADLSPASTNYQWAWLGQGLHCNAYQVSGLPPASAFFILGNTNDPDGDGLTSAYELLITHSDPNKADSSGDGMLDGWKALWGLDPNANNPAQVSKRSNYTYDSDGRLKTVSGSRSESITTDDEGNIRQAQ